MPTKCGFVSAESADDDHLSAAAAMRLDQLIQEFCNRRACGAGDSIDDFVSQYPDLAGELTPMLRVVEELRELKGGRSVQDAFAAVTIDTLPEQLGDFRILREIGRGGMGIVFEALQVSLNRIVALKILPRPSWQEKEIERFHTEAKIAASLHHSNVVPIFAYGESDGHYYFAMQIISGYSLHQVGDHVAELQQVDPEVLTPQWIAKVGIQVADALHYAHLRRTLHRDIKPSNLLLDHNGRVWITDFGVACMFAQQADEFIGQSGTLLFQAPERLQGKCDARSEVYSLGATLLDLALVAKRTSALAKKSLVKPSLRVCPRYVDRKAHRILPADLAAILRKATDQNPESRYQSAKEMEDDLRRFIEGRPVRARRNSWVGCLRRWVARNPTLAAALLVIVGLICTTTGVLVVSQYRTAYLNEQLVIANQDLIEQNQSLTQASFEVEAFVRPAVTKMTAAKSLLSPARGGERGTFKSSSAFKRVLNRLLIDFKETGNLEELKPQHVLPLTVSAPRRIGNVMYLLGQLSHAKVAGKYALELIEHTRGSTDVPGEHLRLLKSQVLNDLADIEESWLNFPAADRYRQQALQELDQEFEISDFRHVAFEKGRAHIGLIRGLRDRFERLHLLCRMSSIETAEEKFDAMWQAEFQKHLYQGLVFLRTEQFHDDDPVSCQLLSGRYLLARAQRRRALPLDRERDFKMGVQFLEMATDRSFWNPRFVHELAAGLASVPLFGWSEGAIDTKSALPHLKLANRLATQLTEDYPQHPEFLKTLAETEFKLGILLSMNDKKSARRHFSSSIATQDALLKEFPDRPRLVVDKAIYLLAMAEFLEGFGSVDEAAEFQQAAENALLQLPTEQQDSLLVKEVLKVISRHSR